MELKLYLTRRCNFRCTYCYVPFKNEEVDPKVVDKIISLLRDEDTLSIFGGEPLLFSDLIIDIVNRLDEKGVKTYLKIFSNGSFIKEDLLEVLKNTKRSVMVQISYDGKRQDYVHPMGGVELTDIEENIKRYLEVFKQASDTTCTRCNLSNGEKTLHIETTVTPDTIEGTYDGIKELVSYGVYSIGVVPVIEVEQWTQEDVEKYRKEWKKIKELVADLYRQGKETFITHLSPFRATNNDLWGCGAGKYLLSVSPDGELWDCHRYYAFAYNNPIEGMKYNKGNILNVDDLGQFENSLCIPVKMEDINCGKCPARQFCTKCHLANKLLNGDEFITPKNGYCNLPFIHMEMFNEMNDELLQEQNPLYIKHLYSILMDGIKNNFPHMFDKFLVSEPTIMDVVKISEFLNNNVEIKE